MPASSTKSINHLEGKGNKVLSLVRSSKYSSKSISHRRWRHNVCKVHGKVSSSYEHCKRTLDKMDKNSRISPRERARDETISNNNDNDDISSSSSDDHESINEKKKFKATYRQYYNTGTSKYGSDGKSRLENLISAALDARQRASSRLPLRTGAAVLASTGVISSACNVLSSLSTGQNITCCAERTALLQAISTDANIVVEAMVISSDVPSSSSSLLPYPCGACREFMTEFGDFAIYLLKPDNISYEKTSSYQLFPCALSSAYAKLRINTTTDGDHASISHRNSERRDDDDTVAVNTKASSKVRQWSAANVGYWVSNTLDLPQYSHNFTSRRIDGVTLLLLEEEDLLQLLGITPAVHRKAIMIGIDKLRDSELFDQGLLDFEQLSDYVAVIDADRIALISKLKETFDRLDVEKTGKISKSLLLKNIMDDDDDAKTAMMKNGTIDELVSFPEFAMALTAASRNTLTPPVTTVTTPDMSHKARIKQLQESGHVRLSRRRRQQQSRYEKDGDSPLSSSDDDEITSKPKQIVKIKAVFRRFCSNRNTKNTNYYLNAIEATQALVELGVNAPRPRLLRYFKRRKVSTEPALDVFGFLEAYAAFTATISKTEQLRALSMEDRRRRHEKYMDQLMDLESKKFGKHRSARRYDKHLREKRRYRQRNSNTSSSESNSPQKRFYYSSSDNSEEESKR